MVVFNIHAGITSKIMIDQVNEYVKQAYKIFPKKMWVFFDEFNTSESIGIICEILCERTLLG